jgi:hypothetical protein
MAVKSSFKQQCPSCEAMVPIRDPGLIGRKIDCPKCKYRFVVEEPAEEADDEDKKAPSGITSKKPASGKAAPKRRGEDDEDDFDDKPKAKKSGGSGMLIVGLGLAAVAVIALAVGGWLLFGSDSDTPDSTSPRASVNSPSSNSKSGEAKQNTPQDAGKPKGEIKPSLPDMTNLLPNETEIVLNIPVEQLLNNSAFKKATLMTPGSFNSGAFQRNWGIPASDITRVVMSFNPHKKAWFSVMRLNKPVKEEQVVAKLKIKPETPVGGMKYYMLKKPLDSLSTTLLKGNQSGDKFALHFVDQYTVVCANLEPMKQFLTEKGKPKHLSEAPSAAPADEAQQGGGPAGMMGGMRGMMPSGMGGPPPGMRGGMGGPPPGMAGGRPGGPPNAPTQQGPSVGGAPGAGGSNPGPAPMSPNPGGSGAGAYQPPSGFPGMGGMPGMNRGNVGSGGAEVSSSYLTIHPDLKAVLDQVEKSEKKEPTVLVSAAALVQLPSVDELQKALAQQPDVPRIPNIVFNVLLSEIGLDMKDVRSIGVGLSELSDSKVSATLAVGTKEDRVAQTSATQLSSTLSKYIPLTGFDIISKTGSNTGTDVAGMNQGMGMMGMGMRGMMPPNMGNRGMMPPGMGQRGMIQPGSGNMPPPGMSNRGMMPPGMGNRGMMPPGGFQGGMMAPGGMQPGGTDQPKELTGKDGEYDLWSKNQVVALNVTLNTKEAFYLAATRGLAEGFTLLKGVAEMTDSRPRIHELAEAIQAYAKAKGHFPRGAIARAPSSDRVIDWRPDQRMSWLVELLPFLAGGEFKDLPIDNEKSWDEPPTNVLTATTVIPQYVAPLPKEKQFEFYINYPGLKGFPLAATHFVGIAGVGLDAAEYRSDDAEKAKLRGVFGYDRVTSLKEIKDGLDNTIVAIQVPTDHKSPWIAGGGSTVRGVSEDLDCVKPFVCTKYKDKDGTFAIMADGKVRFIPANIAPKTFQAMCTIAGGDKITNIDTVAPEVPPPDEDAQVELKAEPAAPPATPVKPQPQPAPPAAGAGAPADARSVALRSNYLKQIGLAYHNYVSTNNKPPSKIEDLAPFYENDAKITALVKDGAVVIIWNSSFQNMTAGTSNTVLGYEKDAKDKGGLVLMADGSVKPMTAKEFNAATKASGK